MRHQQSHTQRDSTQHLFNVMDFTSWRWSLSTFQSTCNWKCIKRPKAQQHRLHLSPWHQQVWRSWGTEMTSGHSTAKDHCGPQRDKQHLTKSGQDQLTLRRQHPTKMRTSQMILMNNKKQERQNASQHRSSLQHKRGSNTSCHTGAGVLYVYKQRVGQTTTRSNTTKHRWFSAISPTIKQLASNQPHQFSQPSMSKQACTWQRRKKTKREACNLCQHASNNSWWNVAEHMQCSTTLLYTQTMRIFSKHYLKQQQWEAT